MMRLLSVAAVCCMLCLSVAGCGGGDLGEVSGKVTMDGKPLPDALVTFVPMEGGRAATGVSDANGNYKLIYIDRDGALIGKHKVTVTTVQKPAPVNSQIRSDDPEYAKMMASKASDYNNATVKEPIPARYNSNTELVKEVTSGDNVIDLPLESK